MINLNKFIEILIYQNPFLHCLLVLNIKYCLTKFKIIKKNVREIYLLIQTNLISYLKRNILMIKEIKYLTYFHKYQKLKKLLKDFIQIGYAKCVIKKLLNL